MEIIAFLLASTMLPIALFTMGRMYELKKQKIELDKMLDDMAKEFDNDKTR